MLSNNKKIAEIGSKVETLESIVKVLKDEMFALDNVIREQGKLIAELGAKLEEKEESLTEKTDEIRKWNEGLANIMNYGLEIAKGDKK